MTIIECMAKGCIQAIGRVNVVFAVLGTDLHTLEVCAGNDVDYTTYRIGTVSSRSTILEYLNTFDHVSGILVDVGVKESLAGGNWRQTGPAPVDQCQRTADTQPTQAELRCPLRLATT